MLAQRKAFSLLFARPYCPKRNLARPLLQFRSSRTTGRCSLTCSSSRFSICSYFHRTAAHAHARRGFERETRCNYLMQLDAIHEELLVLTSSLLDGELAWDDDDARVAWEVSARPRTQHHSSAMWTKALMRG